ncbi:MAG: alpha amylase C-terminal domain-containing protein [Acidobacteria bacterium]|nr:alpha amylase C-terminal domain-containing protein [Acidobacteriota bacterium]
MDYLLIRIVGYLVVAAVIGGAVGWFVRQWLAARALLGYVSRQAHEDLEKRLEDAIDAASAADKARDRLESEAAQLRQAQRSLSAERDGLVARAGELERALEHSKAPVREAEAKLARTEAAKAALEGDLEQLRGDLQELRHANEGLRNERQRLLENRAQLLESIEQCETTTAKLEGERESLLERIAGLEVEKAANLARFRPAPEPKALKPVSVEEVSALFEASGPESRGQRATASSDGLEAASASAPAAVYRASSSAALDLESLAGLSIYRLEDPAADLDELCELGVGALALPRDAPSEVGQAAAERGLAVVDLEAEASLWPDPAFCAAVRAALSPTLELPRRVERMAAALDSYADADALTRLIWTESPEDPQAWQEPDAQRAAGLAAVALLTAPGIPVIAQGQESFGGDPRSRALYRDLLRSRRAFVSESIEVRHRDGVGGVLAYQRPCTDGRAAVIVMNLSGESRRGYYIGVPDPGVWQVRFDSAGVRESVSPQTTAENVEWGGMPHRIPLDLEARSALLLMH